MQLRYAPDLAGQLILQLPGGAKKIFRLAMKLFARQSRQIVLLR